MTVANCASPVRVSKSQQCQQPKRAVFGWSLVGSSCGTRTEPTVGGDAMGVNEQSRSSTQLPCQPGWRGRLCSQCQLDPTAALGAWPPDANLATKRE
jgi:hypothetical protein